MKRIILAVEVPEYFQIDSDTDMMDFANHCIDHEILIPPTDEEIYSVENYEISEKPISDRFDEGAKWMRSQIFGEVQP